MYIAPGQGQTGPWGQNFNVNRKALSLWPFVVSFKKITYNSDFIHIFYVFFHMYIAPGQGQTTPLGSECLRKHIPHVTLAICSKLLPLNDFSNSFFPYKSIRDQIWPCHKIGQGQPRVTIWTNFDGPKAPMLHTKAQGHWPLVPEKKIFEVFFYHIWAWRPSWPCDPDAPNKLSFPPTHGGSTWNLASIGPAVLDKKIFKNGGRTDNGRTTEHAYTISSP